MDSCRIYFVLNFEIILNESILFFFRKNAHRNDTGGTQTMTSGEELLELRKSTVAEYFEIPYRTVQDWELGNRRMPYYLLRLMVYKVDKENLAKQD